MTAQLEVYKCEICGNIVEVLHAGPGQLVCCGQPMKKYEENTVDAAKEKHVPVIEKTAEGFKVKVGSVAHPM
ncbi:MAG TPA: desulfoferrodoxin, partial [Desulfobacterales bacterium]|nr:desulfoferrodoxin [Desulfobacterales bacterium]